MYLRNSRHEGTCTVIAREQSATDKTYDICRAAETMTEQMRIVGQWNNATTSVHAVRQFSGQKNG